jgi:hypothetical protein
MLEYSRLECSKALTNRNLSGKLVFKIDVHGKDKYYKHNPLKLCKNYKNTIMDKLLKSKIIFYSNETLNNSFYSGREKMTFLPHRFDIIIKNGTAYFYIKGDN